MKNHDLVKLALMGMAAGVCLTASPLHADSTKILGMSKCTKDSPQQSPQKDGGDSSCSSCSSGASGGEDSSCSSCPGGCGDNDDDYDDDNCMNEKMKAKRSNLSKKPVI